MRAYLGRRRFLPLHHWVAPLGRGVREQKEEGGGGEREGARERVREERDRRETLGGGVYFLYPVFGFTASSLDVWKDPFPCSL